MFEVSSVGGAQMCLQQPFLEAASGDFYMGVTDKRGVESGWVVGLGDVDRCSDDGI
jgi:hypothetical protein